MQFDAVIFDLFGTLIDYQQDEYYRKCHAQMAEILGVPFDEFRGAWLSIGKERNIGAAGDGIHDDTRYLCERLGIRASEEAVERVTQIRLDKCRQHLPPRDGAMEIVDYLHKQGLKVGLQSDCARELVHLWEIAPLSKVMDATVMSCVERMVKPDQRMFRLMSERLGVEPERCLYVGDGGGWELNGAIEAGMHPVLIRVPGDPWPDTYRPNALEWKGPRVTHLSELVPIIASKDMAGLS